MARKWIKPINWKNEGIEPSDSLKESGFKGGYKPAASIFNYFFHNHKESIEEIQGAIDEQDEDLVGIKEKLDGIDEGANKYTLPVASNELGGVKNSRDIKVDDKGTMTMNVIGEANGDTIALNNSGDNAFAGLSVYGKTTQKTTTGKNLADYSKFVCQGYNGNIDTYSISENIITFNVSYANGFYIADVLKAGVSYIISGKVSKATNLRIYKEDDLDNTIREITFDKSTGKFSAQYTPTYDNEVIRVWVAETDCTLTDFMIRTANITDDTYELYTGGITSPNTNYPQDLVSVGEGVEFDVYGRNFVDVSKLELASNKSLTISQDKYTITVVGGLTNTYAYSHYDMPTDLVYKLRGKEVCLACDYISKSVATAYSPVQLNIKCADGSFAYPVNTDLKLKSFFTVPENAIEIRVGIYTNNSASLLSENNTVIVTGLRLTLPTYTDYEPFTEKQAFAIDNGLYMKGIPVSSGGNYTDNNGQQWICDEYNFEKKKYIQRCVLCKGFSVVSVAGAENTVRYQYKHGSFLIGETKRAAMCTHTDNYTFNTEDKVHFYCHNDGISVYLSADVSSEEIIPNLKVLAALQTPIERDLTDEEIEAYKALHTNKPNTTILSDADVSVKYYLNNEVSEAIKYLEEGVNSLEEDVEVLQKTSENLQIQIDDMQVVETASGSAITIESANAPLQQLKLYGKTTQDGTPTPTEPKELKSVGDSGSFEVGVYRRNILNITIGNLNWNGIPITNNGNGSVTLNGTSNSNWTKYVLGSAYLPKGNYKIMNYGNAGLGCYIEIADLDDTSKLHFSGYTNGELQIFEMKKSKKVNFLLIVQPNTTITNVTLSPMCMSANITDETYEPCDKQTLTMPYTLRSVGDIKDEVDFTRGVFIQRITKYILTENENWQNMGAFGINIFGNHKGGWVINYNNDRLPNTSNAQNLAGTQYALGFNGTKEYKSYLYVSLPESVVPKGDVTAFKNWIANNHITLIYELETPIETPLTETELNAYRQLMTNSGNTTILSEADMTLDYYTPKGQAIGNIHSIVNQDYLKIQQAIITAGGSSL